MMKTVMIKSFTAAIFLSFSVFSFSQREILNRVSPDGSMQYYMEPVNFYWTNTKSLKGCIVTDKENYFFELHPVLVPEKKEGRKLKKDLSLKMSDGITYEIKQYDTHYVEDDSVMEMLFLIDKKDIDRLLNLEVVEAKIDMMGTEGIRTYVFKLHKTALKEQLACF
jgi:iron only hydrogenase large subunit-like protein